MDYLASKNYLTEEGKEVLELSVDEEISIHDRILTAEGLEFFENNITSVLTFNL